MSTVEEIEDAVRRLSGPELDQFREWFITFHAAVWDEQIEHDAGVQLTAARAHRQSIQRGEAHRAVHAAPRGHRAHAGPAAEMRDDDPAERDVRRDLRQRARDVFIGQSVEAVASDAFLIEALRQRVPNGHGGVAAMKRGIEARDL